MQVIVNIDESKKYNHQWPLQINCDFGQLKKKEKKWSNSLLHPCTDSFNNIKQSCMVS